MTEMLESSQNDDQRITLVERHFLTQPNLDSHTVLHKTGRDIRAGMLDIVYTEEVETDNVSGHIVFVELQFVIKWRDVRSNA